MGEAWMALMAASASLGAWWSAPLPWMAGLVGAGIAWWLRRPLLLCVAVLVAAAGLSHRAWQGATPLAPRTVNAWVTLLDDPVDVHGAVRATARLGRAHVELWARGSAGGQVRRRLAGEQLQLLGRIEQVAPSVARRLAQGHVRARVTVAAVVGWSPGAPVSRAANRIHRMLRDGAEVLPPTERALFLGFVLGDDRDQPADVRDEFRASGLAHLTAVSGENER